MVPLRPVWARAILMAFSTASAPVERKRCAWGRPRHQGIQFFRQLDVAGVGVTWKQVWLNFSWAHRRHHLGGGWAGVEHGDAGGEVDVAVALHVP